MADLSLSQVQTNGGIPADSFIVSGGKVMLDISVLTGNSVSALSAECVTEMCYKLLRGCQKAQVQANTTLVAPNRLDTFTAPANAAPTEVNGNYYVVSSITCRARMPVSVDSAEAPLV